MSIISIKNISKTYPPAFPRLRKFFRLKIDQPVEALRDVSLEIERGEIFGLIGKNGAGKTTLTKIIATLVQPTGGTVSVDNYDSVKNDVKVRSLVGLATAEERSFYWRLTCRQNLLFFSRLYAMKDKAAKNRIAGLFEKLDLTHLADRKFSELSTGNKQRLAVARALLADPPILLLDEPTRSLDPLAANNMRKLIGTFKYVSILLTSHNLTEIEELCDRIAVISNGTIRAVDTPENLRKSHRQTQNVKITVASFAKLDKSKFENLISVEFSSEKDANTIKFEREPDDELLGKTCAELQRQNTKILDIETEKPTLLDVLESYDSEI